MLSASLKLYLIERKYSCKLWPWYVHKLALRGTGIISISTFMAHTATKIYRGTGAHCFKTIFSERRRGRQNYFHPISVCSIGRKITLLTSCQLPDFTTATEFSMDFSLRRRINFSLSQEWLINQIERNLMPFPSISSEKFVCKIYRFNENVERYSIFLT